MIEALVVVAIASLLLTVLSQLLLDTQRTHMRLEERFRASETGFYSDLILRRIVFNTLTRPSDIRVATSSPVFSGEARRFSGHVRNDLFGPARLEPFEVLLETRQSGDERLILRLGETESALELPRFSQGRFVFVADDGTEFETWPLRPAPELRRTGEEPDPPQLPDALILEGLQSGSPARLVYRFGHGH